MAKKAKKSTKKQAASRPAKAAPAKKPKAKAPAKKPAASKKWTAKDRASNRPGSKHIDKIGWFKIYHDETTGGVVAMNGTDIHVFTGKMAKASAVAFAKRHSQEYQDDLDKMRNADAPAEEPKAEAEKPAEPKKPAAKKPAKARKEEDADRQLKKLQELRTAADKNRPEFETFESSEGMSNEDKHKARAELEERNGKLRTEYFAKYIHPIELLLQEMEQSSHPASFWTKLTEEPRMASRKQTSMVAAIRAIHERLVLAPQHEVNKIMKSKTAGFPGLLGAS